MTPKNQRRLRKAQVRIERILDSVEPGEADGQIARLETVNWIMCALIEELTPKPSPAPA
ncbi:MAG TPA: hypothetical protein VFZ21_31665 [Gemmatimonadaceae bacterium]|nr:hypothetical protein [Gemmatimonadaceae bacterium]